MFEWSGKNSFVGRESAAEAFADHLRDWFQREPLAEHVIVAHSHGGSVAVAAGRRLGRYEQSHLAKIITLATPFAQVRVSEIGDTLLLARYMVLRFGWISVALLIAFEYILPGGFLSRTAGALLNSCIIVILIASALNLGSRLGLIKFKPPSFPQSFAAGRQQPPTWLLFAVRAPQDEASIAISTSQFINFVSNVLFSHLLVAPFGWIEKQLGRNRSLFFFLYAGLASVVVVAVEVSYYKGAPGLFDELAHDPMDIGALLFQAFVVISVAVPALVLGTAFVIVAMIGPAMLFPANLLLAVALGWDVLTGKGLLEFECEPIPSGITGTVTTVRLSETDRKNLGMAHFIHATTAARSRVAEILREPAPRGWA
jgi:hypothetical protein